MEFINARHSRNSGAGILLAHAERQNERASTTDMFMFRRRRLKKHTLFDDDDDDVPSIDHRAAKTAMGKLVRQKWN